MYGNSKIKDIINLGFTQEQEMSWLGGEV